MRSDTWRTMFGRAWRRQPPHRGSGGNGGAESLREEREPNTGRKDDHVPAPDAQDQQPVVQP